MTHLTTKISIIAFGLIMNCLFSQTMAETIAHSQIKPEKATIAVMSFSDFVPDRTGSKRVGLPDVLAGRIIEKLSNNQRYTVVERKALRRTVLEQRFDKKMEKSYLDKTLDKAIETMEYNTGGEVYATSDWSNYNDVVKSFKDLGTTVGADFIVLGDLEQLKRTVKQKAVPYSTSAKVMQTNRVDARLRLRIIDAKNGTVAGAASIKTKLSESLFQGKESDNDEFTFYDHLASLAAAKILDITFPARIVSLDPLIISRGENDGIKAGDQFTIQNEGKEIRNNSGLLLARLKNKVGMVKVVNIQKTIAIVDPVSGGNFQLNDLAELENQAINSQIEAVTQSPVALKKTKQAAGTGGTAKIPRIAIGLVKAGSTARTGTAQIGMNAQEHTPIFTDTMISRLAQTKRFQLIDRQEVDQLLNEQLAQALAENRNVSSAMGTLKGADYLVYGNLASLSDKEQVTKLPGSLRVFKQRIGQVSGNMRIVDARSGDIIESRKISVEQAIDLSASNTEMIDKLADAYSEQVVLMLMNALYPIKAAHISNNGIIYINRGNDGGLFVGEELDIYKSGQAIIDPDTGVQLGVEESYVGKVVVTEVEDARSKGEQIEGTGIARGDLLKRTIKNKTKRSSVASNERQTAPKRTGGTIGKKTTAKGRLTLAMGSIDLNRSARTIYGFNKGHLGRVSDDIITGLTNSKRFTLMEREQVDQILDEKTFETITSGGDIQARLGELSGADYLIHGELNNFYIDTKRKKVPYMDEIQVISTTHAEGVFRIADAHTGAIISSEKITINEQIKGITDQTQIVSKMIAQYSTRSVAKIIARLYPIKVMGSSADGAVYLNRGADSGVKVGEHYVVMRPGQALVDPDTGESFGSAESKVATIRVTEVEGARSRAELLSGSSPVSGDILRKSSKPAKKPKQRVMQPSW
ncbi:MAG: hypothetical protein KZQ83_11370 [gamma proteobacterium symbiont of Taylorina sp.]|nr:hypothetical protein [gamma proteobacterium symbiont of Taylorina sp.]